MNRDDLLRSCHRAVEAARSAGADEAEVFATATHQTEVTLQKNDLDQVSVSEETTYGVRVLKDGRLGFATTNRGDALAETAAEAVAMAKASPVDPLAGLPDPQPVPEADDDVDEGLLGLDAAALAGLAMRLLAAVRSRDGRVNVDSGGLRVDDTTRAVASSRGVSAAWRGVDASGDIFGMAVDGADVGSFAYDGEVTNRRDHLEEHLGRAFSRFVDKAVGALGARPGESFRGPIVLTPECLAELLVPELVAMLGADAVRKGHSPLGGRLGEAIAVPGFTLREAGAGLPGHPLSPFDREGMPRTAVDLVRGGVLGGLLYDGLEARAAGVSSTGHAGGGPSALPSVSASVLAIEPGGASWEALIGGPRAVVVPRFSGSTDPISGDWSGVVKGGFLAHDGVLTPIRETSIAGNLYRDLLAISAIGSDVTVLWGSRAFPALRIEDVSITAG